MARGLYAHLQGFRAKEILWAAVAAYLEIKSVLPSALSSPREEAINGTMNASLPSY